MHSADISKTNTKKIGNTNTGAAKNNQIIPSNQSGFGYNCNTALLNISDDIIGTCDRNKLAVLLLLDYTKAFDTINHKMLISILHFIDFIKGASKLLANYLGLIW